MFNNAFGNLLVNNSKNTSFVWGTVVSMAPLRIKLDGSQNTLPAIVNSIATTVANNTRVLCLLSNGSLTVLGMAHGDNSQPLTNLYVIQDYVIFRGFKPPSSYINAAGNFNYSNLTPGVFGRTAGVLYSGSSFFPYVFNGNLTIYGIDSAAIPELHGVIPIIR